jgi:drug/metabolite transporter (DMT)-like permease
MWFWLSIGAAVLWGLDYALTGQVLKKISFPTLLVIELLFGFIVTAIVAMATGGWKQDFVSLSTSKSLLFFVAVIVICFVIANLMITASIQEKGASIASLIEISYPFFVVLFSWFLFKDESVNTATLLGGVLVFMGVSIIYIFNR